MHILEEVLKENEELGKRTATVLAIMAPMLVMMLLYGSYVPALIVFVAIVFMFVVSNIFVLIQKVRRRS